MSIEFRKPRFIAALGGMAVTGLLMWRSYVWELESVKFRGMRGFAPEADIMVAFNAPMAWSWQLTPPLYGTIADLHGVPFILLSGVLWCWVGRTWELWRQGSDTLHFSRRAARTATSALFLVIGLLTGAIAILLGMRMVERPFEWDWHMAMGILERILYLAWSVGLMAVAIRDLRRCFSASKK